MHLCNCWDVVKCIYAKNSKREHYFTNYIDPDETPLNAASHLGLRYLQC